MKRLKAVAYMVFSAAVLAPALAIAGEWVSICDDTACYHCSGSFCVSCDSNTGVCRPL